MTSFWDSIHSLDQAYTLFMNGLGGSTFNSFMIFMSDVKVWFPLYALIIAMLIWKLGWKKGLISVVCLALCLLACDQTSNLLKYSVGRLRPCYSETMVSGGLSILEKRGGLFGFFSAHSANAFGLALCSTICLRNASGFNHKIWGWGIFIWAALVAISRVFVGKHYIGDIVVGMGFGLLWGYAIATIAVKLIFPVISTRRKA